MKRLFAAIMILCLTLAAFSALAETEPFFEVLATGDVHVRAEAKLTGKDLFVLKKGKTLPFGGGISVDERGVAWYLVAADDDTWGWTSSKYSVITDGTVEGIDFLPELRDTEMTLLSGDTLAVSPFKGIGCANVAAGTAVTALGYAFTDGENTRYYVCADGEYGWVNAINLK